MKIEYYEGCDLGIEIDNKGFYGLSYEEQKNILHKIIDKSSEYDIFDMLLIACINMGDCEDLGYCEQCGSNNYKYTINID